MSIVSYDFLKTHLRSGQGTKQDSFVNSPLYYMLTGRKGAWLYRNAHSCLVVCAHPHTPDRLLVFPEVGKSDYELTASVLNMIDPPANGVQLARYGDDALKNLQRQLGKLNYTAISGIAPIEEDVMDWRYPARVLDTRLTGEAKGGKFAKIRNKFRQAANDTTIIPLEGRAGLKLMRAALKFWEGNMIFNDKDTDDMSDMYHALFDLLETMDEQPIHGLLFQQKRRPAGFTLWDTPYHDTANLLVNLSDTSLTGLSDLQMIEACKALHKASISTLNLGGSELSSLDFFKAKFQPVETLKLISARVNYRTQGNTNIHVDTLIEPC